MRWGSDIEGREWGREEVKKRVMKRINDERRREMK